VVELGRDGPSLRKARFEVGTVVFGGGRIYKKVRRKTLMTHHQDEIGRRDPSIRTFAGTCSRSAHVNVDIANRTEQMATSAIVQIDLIADASSGLFRQKCGYIFLHLAIY
jgi:hypothetical protein